MGFYEVLIIDPCNRGWYSSGPEKKTAAAKWIVATTKKPDPEISILNQVYVVINIFPVFYHPNFSRLAVCSAV